MAFINGAALPACSATKAVVASFVELSVVIAVGAVGVTKNDATPLPRLIVNGVANRLPSSLKLLMTKLDPVLLPVSTVLS